MNGREKVTREQALTAQDALEAEFGIFQLVGPETPTDTQHFPQSIGVTAEGRDFADHFIKIQAPPTFDVSHIPTLYYGVRVVIDQDGPPGMYVAT
jgi:hypothetical protein